MPDRTHTQWEKKIEGYIIMHEWGSRGPKQEVTKAPYLFAYVCFLDDDGCDCTQLVFHYYPSPHLPTVYLPPQRTCIK